ncbi:Hint domain-containing protein [Roseicyclus mahoneyensis]|nr:Hint domain-containing protein [Roseicyclus mahoneyensis]
MTFLGTVTFGSITFLHFRSPFGESFLDSIDPVSLIDFFPTSFSTTDPEYSTANFVLCFLQGTLIRTSAGDVAVEKLAIGDKLLTAAGAATTVEWIVRQSVSPRFGGSTMLPVRIKAGGLGHGLPETDLYVSADHGLILDDLMINAGALVNGTTITVMSAADLPDRITYYHVETTSHEVILANGTPAETFIDYAGRQRFDNYAEYVELFGADRPLAEMARARISAARHLPAALRRHLGLTSAA